MQNSVFIFVYPKLFAMKTNLPNPNNSAGIQFTSEFSLDDQLLEIYWAKKELEEFLPKIATYAQPNEVANIALSQLTIIEKRVIWLLEAESRGILECGKK